jgi:hypothetical protein
VTDVTKNLFTRRKGTALIILFAAGALSFQLPIKAQDAAQAVSDEGIKLAPGATLLASQATIRTAEQMAADEAAGTYAVSGSAPISFRPTISDSEYAALKAMGQANSVSGARSSASPAAPLGPPTFQGVNFAGISQSTLGNPCGCFPPDTHGAVGLTQYLQIVNSAKVVWTKAGGLVSSIGLNTLMGYSATLLFDPQAYYDSRWNRFVITAEGSPEPSGAQLQFIAISTSSNAAGSFIVYAINVAGVSGGFWDYPHMGLDIDAFMITANRFNAAGTAYFGAGMFAVDKAILYNGLGFSTPVFFTPASHGTLAPPFVLDQSRNSVFLAAPPSGTSVFMWRLRDSGRAFQETFLFAGAVAVPAYSAPPNASQPGTAQVLDTLDARFVNASAQISAFIYNIHSVAFGAAALRWYRINLNTVALVSSATFFESGTDATFNASLVVDGAQRMYVSYSRTDAPAGAGPQAKATGKLVGDANLGPGILLAVGPSLTGNFDPGHGSQRWGDNSSVSLDPNTFTAAGNPMVWTTNERSLGGSWGSVISRIGY